MAGIRTINNYTNNLPEVQASTSVPSTLVWNTRYVLNTLTSFNVTLPARPDNDAVCEISMVFLYNSNTQASINYSAFPGGLVGLSDMVLRAGYHYEISFCSGPNYQWIYALWHEFSQ